MEESNLKLQGDGAVAKDDGITARIDAKLAKLSPTGRVAVLLAAALLVIFCIYECADLLGCFEFTYPASVLDHKTSIVNGNTEFDVTIMLDGWSAGSVYKSANEMKEIVKHEVKEGGQEQSILFRIVGVLHTVGGYDKYGNPIPGVTTNFNAFNILFSLDDMRKVNWDNMSGSGLLNLGAVTRFGSYGDIVLKSYCEEPVAQTYSQDFCANF